MARRKDHSPKELKALIVNAAHKIISTKGLINLTARNLAREVGYTPGTIYNFYRDMEALVVEANFITLENLIQTCRDRTADRPPDFSKIRAFAYAYYDFVHNNVLAWNSIFHRQRLSPTSGKLPKRYRDKILSLSHVIENILEECFCLSKAEAAPSARLLWACLHGITVLSLDGRLKHVGPKDPHKLIDALLDRYFYQELKKAKSGQKASKAVRARPQLKKTSMKK